MNFFKSGLFGISKEDLETILFEPSSLISENIYSIWELKFMSKTSRNYRKHRKKYN
jgi:hypothetical protein